MLTYCTRSLDVWESVFLTAVPWIDDNAIVQRLDWAIQGIPEDIRRVFVTDWDIEPEWHVRMQAVFQKYADNSVSKTVNLPAEATPQDIKRVYTLAHELKCKGITIYRYGSKKQQVLTLAGHVPETAAEPARYVTAESEYAGGCPYGTCPF